VTEPITYIKMRLYYYAAIVCYRDIDIQVNICKLTLLGYLVVPRYPWS